jgi:hypothetical protein
MRRTRGDRHGENFVNWLNRTGGTKSLLALLDQAKHLGRRPDLFSLPPDGPEHNKAFHVFRKFQRNLIQFRFRPFVSLYSGTEWEFAWECRRGSGTWEFADDPRTEAAALFNLLRLAEAGKLRRVRRCDCGKWLVARRSDQEFCSTRCRQRAFATTEKFKKRRREYMRKYYRLKMSGKVK